MDAQRCLVRIKETDPKTRLTTIRKVRATVYYTHPAGRYYTVLMNGFRECFWPEEVELL